MVIGVIIPIALGAAKWLAKSVFDRMKDRVSEGGKAKTQQFVDKVMDQFLGPRAKLVGEMNATQLQEVFTDALVETGAFKQAEASEMAADSLNKVRGEIADLSYDVNRLISFVTTSVNSLCEYIGKTAANQLDEFEARVKRELRELSEEQAKQIFSGMNAQLTSISATVTKIASRQDVQLLMLSKLLEKHGVPLDSAEMPKRELSQSFDQEVQRAVSQLGNLKTAAPEAGGERAETLVKLGNYYISKGLLQQAIDVVDEAIRLEPNNTWAWSSKGLALNRLDRFEEAMRYLEEATRLNPKNAKALSSKGYSLFRLGRYEEAMRYYDEAIRLDPEYAMVWNNKGVTLDQLGKHGEALKYLSEAIRLDPMNALFPENKGDVLLDIDRFEEAIDCYDEAIRMDSESVGAWAGKAEALFELKRFEEATNCYNKTLGLIPEEDTESRADAWSAKGDALFNLGRFEESIDCYNEVLRIDPKSKEAKENRKLAEKELKQRVSAERQVHANEPTTSGPYCQKCGNPIIVDDRFKCRKCGARLEVGMTHCPECNWELAERRCRICNSLFMGIEGVH